jgi:hypothetical protein
LERKKLQRAAKSEAIDMSGDFMDSVSDRFNRMTMAIALAEEFTTNPQLNSSGHVVTMIHRKWMPELELRLRRHGWRIGSIKDFGLVKIVTLVDNYR